MNLKRKAFLLIAFISMFNCLSLIQNTYAKYSSDVDTSTNISIAKWNILVNNKDIKNSNDFSNSVVAVFTGNDNINDGVIAPTAEGYFDIVVNTSNVDVSYKMDMSINVSNDSAVKDLIITGYTVNNGPLTSLNTSSYNLSSSVSHSETVRIYTYRFYVKWDDSESSTMNNEEDTNTTINSGKAKFDIVTSFIQQAN